MKKLYVLFFAVLACSITQAQINKGTTVLGGSLFYNDQSYSNDMPGVTSNSNGSKSLGIDASFGKAIKDNLVLGVDISYEHLWGSYSPGSATTGNDLVAGIFLRKYIHLGQGFYLFGETTLSGGYMHNSQPVQQGSQLTGDVSDSYVASIRFFPGIAYALSPKWQLEVGLPSFLTIGYSHTKQTIGYTTLPDDIYNSHSWTATAFTGASTLTAGVRYFIGN
ncbi:MAG TPA: hypothetical protein VNW04_09395 [Puia sp.]|nr:hypothetical protein [Puia sp.]